MALPAKSKIYHIVHVDRLASIIASGGLFSDAQLISQPIAVEYTEQPSQSHSRAMRTILFLPSLYHAVPDSSGQPP